MTFLEGGHPEVLFPRKAALCSLFCGCRLGLDLKKWTFNTGFCKVPRETDKRRARMRTKVGAGFDPRGRQIMRGLIQVKGRKKKARERKRRLGCILESQVTECNLPCCRDRGLTVPGSLQQPRDLTGRPISQEDAGRVPTLNTEEVGSALPQTADEGQNLLSELIKAPSRELMAYTIASKRKPFPSDDCTLDQTKLHKPTTFSKAGGSGKDVA